MATRWLEAHVKENNRQEAPTEEQLEELGCLKDSELFETMCDILNIPVQVKRIWARRRLMPWLRAYMTAALNEMSKSIAYVEAQQSVNFVPAGHRVNQKLSNGLL